MIYPTHERATALQTRRVAAVKGQTMARPPSPSMRALAGIALILLLIVVWGALVASLAQLIGRWPILVQAAFYLVAGIIWIIPLKPLVRWIVTGSFRTRP